VTDPTLVNRP